MLRKQLYSRDIQEEDLKGFGRLIKFGDEGEKGVKGEFFLYFNSKRLLVAEIVSMA